jgi:hypothetical protein
MNKSVQLFADKETSGAEFSECRKYRFALWRKWANYLPLVMFIGLNPSTANETEPDPTIKSVTRLSKNLGYGGFYMMNCFPFVSTDPDALHGYDKEVFSQHQFFLNNQKLKEVSALCKDIVFAWGNFDVVKELSRDEELSQMFPDAKALILNKNGSPRHPLYVSANTKLIPFKQ